MKLWYIRGAWASRKAKAMLPNIQPQAIRRIAVIRHGALGDMVMVRPLLLELRRHFPNAELTLSLVTNYTYSAPTELVDRVHVVYGNDRRDVSRREQIRKMRELGPQDIIFDCADTSRGYWLTLLSSARLKIGYPFRTWQRYVFYDAAVFRSDFVFEADNMLHMLQLFGLKTQHPPVPSFPGVAKEHPRQYVVYFPTASIISKCWPVERFAELIARMAATYPHQDHFVMQGVTPWETIEPIMRQLGGYANVQGIQPGPLAECVSYIKGAALVVANDTGVRNLAIAAGTPTVGILFATFVPYRYWPLYGLHDVVFTPDAQIPSVDAVYASAVVMMKKVSPGA
jgi:ADP-heptose:LPS heptosyltransferase